jgi:membrane protein YdbS with pleckstrin-like domain
MEARGLHWSQVSDKVIGRIAAEGAVIGLVALAVAYPAIGPFALLILLYPAVAAASGVLIYHNLGYAHVEGHFVMRWGIVGRYRAYIPLRKVQAVALRAGPWDRLFGLARLVVYVAGSAPTMLRHLTRADAVALQRELATTASSTRFVW